MTNESFAFINFMFETAPAVKETIPAENNTGGKLDLPEFLPRSSQYLINRDSSLLEFFHHVLDEGLNESQPLLERLKFLSIFSSNVDEFFMIRVAGIKDKLQYKGKLSADGMTPEEQLVEIRKLLLEMNEEQTNCLNEDILPALSNYGIEVLSFDQLTDSERHNLTEYFEHKVYPILTPQAVDYSHPFPYIAGGELNIGLTAKPKVKKRVKKVLYETSKSLFVRIEIPQALSRFVPVEKDSARFVLIEDLIASHVQMLMPEAKTENCHVFRVTRDGDIEIKEEEAHDLLESMEETLKQRRFGDVVRLEVSQKMPPEMVEYLTASLEIEANDVYQTNGALKIADFMSLYKIDRSELKDEPLHVYKPEIFNTTKSTFEIIKRGDVLLHHPYMPYGIVTDFIKEAVEDENVMAIKMCLYRTGANSPIPPLLIEASERGKQVTVLVELKARFDEENNIGWAKRLERAGINVIYGVLGLKTHCKTTLIVRREENDELRNYVHVATGNYNPETSAFYTDLGLLTDDEQIGADASELFNFLTAYSQQKNFRKLLVAPLNLRERMLEMIERETINAEKGLPARIIAKMNRLADVEIIRALYAASQAGVKIDLIVRGVCMLRPGVEGLSENITVRSIVGRLLEHSRVYYFANGGDEQIYLGSSDWMPRNLDRRVEVLTPIENEAMKRELKENFLLRYLKDTTNARVLMPDGSYEKVVPTAGQEAFNSQISFQHDYELIECEGNY